jgi:nitrite reductase/ring-hydroxylating ferredoxin subunit
MVRLCSTDELPPVDEVRDFQLPSGRRVCIANVRGRVYAMDNVCPHQGAALGQGTVEQGFVVCPWHGFQFNPVTGVAEQDFTYVVERYDIEIVGEEVFVNL